MRGISPTGERRDMAKILIVENATFVRSWCCKLLREQGYEVVEATSRAEALEAYREEKPDGVLLDITTRGTDGVGTIEEIMRMDPSARVAMVTAMGQQPAVVNALNAGARDFVMKPFDGNRVLDAVEKLLG